MKNLETKPVATLLVVIVAIVGAALVILSALDAVTDPQLRIGFRDYIEALVIALAGLAIGRGVAKRPRA